jgi:hypothetical protein
MYYRLLLLMFAVIVLGIMVVLQQDTASWGGKKQGKFGEDRREMKD